MEPIKSCPSTPTRHETEKAAPDLKDLIWREELITDLDREGCSKRIVECKLNAEGEGSWCRGALERPVGTWSVDPKESVTATRTSYRVGAE
ncbi:hypothetical protein N7462_010065 [Penicillium macrosclerotiorum]|uniref:uncharacterized protein n=1 Tax=Penicillium macrosclerotiorum TaxID=303699 RepID=UPI002546A4A7|nr:uncharacterized protein N7462_010065 [Penicillium macrosclerotiorum]KAJ5668995.1 hypothetical protein N7462_010065 [Penicillium macrosclerotiorum]